jgi:hypothetical protein
VGAAPPTPSPPTLGGGKVKKLAGIYPHKKKLKVKNKTLKATKNKIKTTGERLKVLRGSGGFFSKNPPEKNIAVKRTKN